MLGNCLTVWTWPLGFVLRAWCLVLGALCLMHGWFVLCVSCKYVPRSTKYRLQSTKREAQSPEAQAEALPHKRSQHFEILEVRARIVVRSFQNEGCVCEFRMLGDATQRLVANVSFADMPVPIDARVVDGT